jgi:hypothetical protein
MGTSSRDLTQTAYQQFKEFLIIALYLWTVLGLLVLHSSMILSEHHIDFAYHGLALFNALALAKVMLVAKDLHLGEQFNERPLIYPTLLKSALFTMVLACFKILEDAVIGFYRHVSFQQSIGELGGGTLAGFLTLVFLVFALLIPFVGYGELGRVLGEGKLHQIFFRPHPSLPRWSSSEDHTDLTPTS